MTLNLPDPGALPSRDLVVLGTIAWYALVTVYLRVSGAGYRIRKGAEVTPGDEWGEHAVLVSWLASPVAFPLVALVRFLTKPPKGA